MSNLFLSNLDGYKLTNNITKITKKMSFLIIKVQFIIISSISSISWYKLQMETFSVCTLMMYVYYSGKSILLHYKRDLPLVLGHTFAGYKTG